MDGQFRFGKGKFFEPMVSIPLSYCDISILLLAGGITAGIAYLLNRKKEK